MFTFITQNEQETEALGYRLASFLRYEDAPTHAESSTNPTYTIETANKVAL